MQIYANFQCDADISCSINKYIEGSTDAC